MPARDPLEKLVELDQRMRRVELEVNKGHATGAGVTDHGALAGLADDDHTQYHTDARALTWLGGRSTSDLPEGSNLYHTNARVDARLTNANIPNDLTLDNITQITTRDHGDLSDLGADDHAQYVFGAGRSGGQTIKGGDAAGETLTLESTADSAKGDIIAKLDQLLVEGPTSYSVATDSIFEIGLGQTITLNAGGGLRAMRVNPAVTIAGDPAGVSLLLFNFGCTVTLGNNAAYDINGTRIFSNQPTYVMTANVTYGDTGTGTTNPMSVIADLASFQAKTGTESATVTHYTSLRQALTVGDGWTITNLRTIHDTVPAGTGVITTKVTVDVEDYGSRVGTALSLRSLGAAVQMRHAGPVVVGANAAPTNASTGLEVQSTTLAFLLPRMTTTQKNALTAVNGMMVYDTTLNAIFGYENGAWVDL